MAASGHAIWRRAKLSHKLELDTAESHSNRKVARRQHAVNDRKEKVHAPFDGGLEFDRSTRVRWYPPASRLFLSSRSIPVYVDFRLPQQQLAELKQGLAVQRDKDAIPGRDFEGN